MILSWLADAVLLLHFGFILFVVLGGFLLVRWPRVAWLHIPAILWGALVQCASLTCPLSSLEVALRRRGGAAGFTGGFIEHYLTPLIHPGRLNPMVPAALGALALLINAVVYGHVLAWQRRRRIRATSG